MDAKIGNKDSRLALVETMLAQAKVAQEAALDEPRRGPDEVFPEYRGDMFGTRGDYMEGMVYRSRMKAKAGMRMGAKKQPKPSHRHAMKKRNRAKRRNRLRRKSKGISRLTLILILLIL